MTKKILASALAGLMILSSASALACNNDSFIGYDIADAQGRYGKIYYCPEVGKNIIDGYASTVEWVHAFYEAEYPHKEVQTLVLDGKDTGLTRYSGNYANAAVELRPDFWEAKAPYDVYHRLYSSLEGGAYKPSTVVGYAGLQEDIKVSFPVVGFDRFVVVNGEVMNYYNVYNALQNQVTGAPVGYTELDSLIDQYYNAVTDANGQFTEAFYAGEEDDWKYDMFYNAIPQYTWETLEGPNYYTGETQTVVPMQILGDKLDEYSKKSNATGYHPEYYDDVIAAKTRNSQDVKWVTVGYEKEYPYRIYQVLCVNGVLLNGAAVKTPAEGQKKVGETVVATYDMNVLDGVDNVYTSGSFDNDERHQVNDYDLKTETYTDYTNALYYDRYNIFSNNNFAVEQYDMIPGMDVSTVQEGYEDTITMTQNVLEDKTTNLPYVFRYTGGVAHPTVEWKVAWPEAEYPYTIYEEKYLDGRPTGIYRSTETSAEAIPSVSEANPKVGNGIRVLKVTLSGDNIQDSCLHDALIAKGYKFIVNGQNVSYWSVPAVIYPGHAFQGSGSFYFGPNNEYVTEVIETGFEEAQQALLGK